MTGLSIALVLGPIIISAVVLTVRDMRREADASCMFCDPAKPCEVERAPEPAPAATMPMLDMAGLYSDDDYAFGPVQAWCEAESTTDHSTTGAIS
ncbi:MAG TPA: hypothetical protein VFE72_03985 [Lysobacter sp.]|nr:hypothetical protein [Lysobacter sp.]